ncbi:MAG: DEAD/DEAH box helicase, partial [Lentisphaeria bacterium]|nr:DEAD/DEAH box helicase [Lentisphaeria bacterium]
MIRETDAFFGPESPLKRAAEFGGRPYEERPQQLRMAQETAAHLQAGTKVCIEAPTGVGKTFAYLVPAIHFALENECPVVVSTHTISLQEQIVEKDVPLLEKLLNLEFTAVLAKGRSNYICLRRLNGVTSLDQQLLAGGGLLSEIEQICRWAQDTRDGTRGDLPFVPDRGLWQSICCEVGNCLNANCEFFPRCHLMRARRRLQSCQLIIVNHALFFSDLSMKLSSEEDDAGVLPAYGAVILDEGQTLEDSASNHLGLRVSSAHLKYVLNRLYNEQRDRGLLGDLMFTDARLAAADCARKAEAFFRKIVDWMEPQRQNPLRYATPGHIPSFLDDPLRQLETELEKLASDNADKDERRQEIGSLAQLLHGERMAMHDFFNMTEPG